MKNLLYQLPKYISYAFILLFTYAAVSKMLDFEKFQVQLGQSPLVSAYAGVVSYCIIGIELIIAIILLIPKTRTTGLYASFTLMVAFTVYIYLILKHSDFVPCSCGGILEKMGWDEHLIFNIGCTGLALTAGYIIDEKRSDIEQAKLSSMLFVISSVSVIILFLSSEYIIKKENNFTRRFLVHPVIEKRTYQLDNNYYYFAGFDKGNIFLGNRKYPLSLTEIDSAFSKRHIIYIEPDRTAKFKNITVKVSGSDYYVYDGTVPIILKGDVKSSAAKTISFQDAYFNQLAVIDSSHFLLRTQSAADKNFVIGDLNLENQHKLKLYPDVLQKQVDGVFDIDGQLHVDGIMKNAVYVYAYRNEFIVLNKKVAVERRLNTIDTIKTAQIKIKQLSDGSYQMVRPPLMVNSGADVYGGILFNHSLLMGKFESKAAWNKADVIDMYKTDGRNYIGSFYLYKKNTQLLNSFMMTKSYFYTIQNNVLTQYTVTPQISKYFKEGEAENPVKE